MGVLACDRKDCENIMCDRYSDDYGYICHECYDELISSGPTTNIKKFMETPKQPNEENQSRARYEAEFEFQKR